jgi:hypothetical protein
MPRTESCPACRAVLRIQDYVTEAFITCPLCLGKVPNAAPADSRRLCIACAEEIREAAKICPHCREPQDGMGLLPSVEAQVRSDSTFFTRAMIPLAILGLWGLVSVVSMAEGMQEWHRLAIAAAGIAVIVSGIVGLRSKENRAAQGIARMVMGGLALAGVLVAAGMAMALAVVVYLFIVCATQLKI